MTSRAPPPPPAEPLPSSQAFDLDRVASAVDFPISVPTLLGEPDAVAVADGRRVVSMSWRDGTVVLDQFDGQLGPVFAKQVGGLELVEVDLDGVPGWWVPGPHDLIYVDAAGDVRTATARLAGRTLLWETGFGVTYRLEGGDLARSEAIRIARSLAGTS